MGESGAQVFQNVSYLTTHSFLCGMKCFEVNFYISAGKERATYCIGAELQYTVVV